MFGVCDPVLLGSMKPKKRIGANSHINALHLSACEKRCQDQSLGIINY